MRLMTAVLFVTIALGQDRVELEQRGCELCGSGALWRITGPGDVGQSVLYGDPEPAEHEARELNRAYQKGLAARAALAKKKPCKT